MTGNYDFRGAAPPARVDDSNDAPGARMGRRASIKWMLAAAASVAVGDRIARAATEDAGLSAGVGYGTDPDLIKGYKPGDCWPLVLTTEQRRAAGALCDVIIPADAESPAATAVGVSDFIDEWISAPYPKHKSDRRQIVEGLDWLDQESRARFGRPFADLGEAQMRAICDDICYVPAAKPELKTASRFFARFRDLTAGGYYTTSQGMSALRYVGNTPLASWDGPPQEVLAKVGVV